MPIPPEYLPIERGLFALRGGPLCGLTTDVAPLTFCIIPLDYMAPDGQHWLCEYRYNPDDYLYDFMEMERVSWG